MSILISTAIAFFFFTPVDDDLFADTNVERFPGGEGDAPTNTPPFDLGELGNAREIDPEQFPSGNKFLEDILNGQFEFPNAEEGGSYFLAADGAFSDGIDETTQGLIGLSDIDDVIESSLRPSKAGSETTRGVQAIQKRLDGKDPAYKGFSKTQEDVEKIIEETLGSSNINPIIKTGKNKNQQFRVDIFNSATGRGVRFVNGKFDTFVNLK